MLGGADGVVAEAELLELVRFQEVAAVEEEGGLVHVLVDGRKVERTEFVPLREDRDRVGAIGGCGGGGGNFDVFCKESLGGGAEAAVGAEHRLLEFGADL